MFCRGCRKAFTDEGAGHCCSQLKVSTLAHVRIPSFHIGDLLHIFEIAR